MRLFSLYFFYRSEPRDCLGLPVGEVLLEVVMVVAVEEMVVAVAGTEGGSEGELVEREDRRGREEDKKREIKKENKKDEEKEDEKDENAEKEKREENKNKYERVRGCERERGADQERGKAA